MNSHAPTETTANPAAIARIKAVRWTDNVKPVEPEVERAVIDRFVGDQQVTTTSCRLRRHDISKLTPRGLLALSLYASGLSITQVAKELHCPHMDAVRAFKWSWTIHGLACQDLRALGQEPNIPEAIRSRSQQHKIPGPRMNCTATA